MKKIRILIAIGVITMGLFNIGCSKKAELQQKIEYAKEKYRSEEYQLLKYSEIMKQKLEEKYRKNFEIKSVERVPGMTALDQDFYLAQVGEVNTKDEFRAYWYVEKEVLQDTYAKIIYKKEFNNIMENVLEHSIKLQDFQYKIYYRESEKYWKEEEFLDYLTESGTYLDIECKLEEIRQEESVADLYQIIRVLNKNGMKYYIRCNCEYKTIYLNDDMKIESVAEILEKLIN